VTLNPDFSQVEADAAQLGINNNFTLFFPERRAFFVENQDLFDTIYNLVNTRNIFSPDYGLKLTGRSGKHAYGVFAADDEVTTLLVPGNVGSGVAILDQESENFAFRYRYDANDKLSVGWLGTARLSDDYRNEVTGVDATYRATKRDTFQFQAIHSDTEYPDILSDIFCESNNCDDEDIECSFGDCDVNEQVLRARTDENGISDNAYALTYAHSDRNWSSLVSYFEIGGDFRSDLGFRNRVDLTQFFASSSLIYIPETEKWWKRFEHSLSALRQQNDNGELISRSVSYLAQLEGPLQLNGTFNCTLGEQIGNRQDETTLRIEDNTRLFRQDQCFLFAQFQPLSNVVVGVESTVGSDIDFANDREGDRVTVSPRVEYSFNQFLRIEADYVFDQLEAEDERVFTARQLDFRLNYNLNVRNFIRLSLIYTDIDFNLDNNPQALIERNLDNREKTLATQLLYQYEVSPQTVFFLGYSDNAIQNDDITSFTRDTRSIFMKISYAFLR
jgi:hypothetical protein